MGGALCLESSSFDREVSNIALRLEQERAARFFELLSPLLLKGEPSALLGAVLREKGHDGVERSLVFIPDGRDLAPGLAGGANVLWIWPSAHDDEIGSRVEPKLLESLKHACSVGGLAADGANIEGMIVNTIKVDNGCWHLLSPPLSYRQSSKIMSPVTGGILFFAAIVAASLLGLDLLRSLHAHTALMHDLKLRRRVSSALPVRSPVKELSPDCLRLNQLIAELHGISGQIIRAAEDTAHELKTPLAVIGVALKQIRRDLPNSSAKITAALEAADQSVERMFLSINDAQALEEESAALIVTPRWRADLRAATTEALRRFAAQIELRRLRVTGHIDDEAWIATSADMLDALLSNVIGNAIGASPDAGEIRIVLRVRGGEAILATDDEGSAISSDFVDELFTRGRSPYASTQRSGAAGSDKRRGGYFVAKRNANLLGGDLTISNRPGGKGLSIVASLPLF